MALGGKDTCSIFGVQLGLKQKCSSDLEILYPFEHVFDGLFWIFGLFYDGSLGVPRGSKN